MVVCWIAYLGGSTMQTILSALISLHERTGLGDLDSGSWEHLRYDERPYGVDLDFKCFLVSLVS